MRLIRDSRGGPSWTITLGVPVAVVLTIKFALGGIAWGTWAMASIDPLAYVGGITAVFTFIAQREFISKKNGGNGYGNSHTADR